MITDQELVDKYSKLCGFLAWRFVQQDSKKAKRGEQDNPLFSTEDVQDFACAALIRLVKCPQEHRHEPGYVKTIITNAIITAWQKRLKELKAEKAPDAHAALVLGIEHPSAGTKHGPYLKEDFFEHIPAPNHIEEKIHDSLAFERISEHLNDLPAGERIVIQLNFGLDGCRPVGLEQIAKKLGRTKWWCLMRLRKGIERIRGNMGICIHLWASE